jgi:hypothetical protein
VKAHNQNNELMIHLKPKLKEFFVFTLGLAGAACYLANEDFIVALNSPFSKLLDEIWY